MCEIEIKYYLQMNKKHETLRFKMWQSFVHKNFITL